MSKTRTPSRDDTAPAPIVPRSGHGRQPSAGGPGQVGGGVDPHPGWLRNWRSLRTGLQGCDDPAGLEERARDLQSRIAHTPAQTLAGLQAQAELISELAWNDVVASTARQLLAGIKRLRRSGRA